MMGNRLGESSLLTHAFAVACYPPVRCITQLHPFERLPSQPGGLGLTHPVQHQAVEDKLPSGDSAGKGIELCAVADVQKEFSRVAWGKVQNGNVSARWLNQTCHEVQQRRLAGT